MASSFKFIMPCKLSFVVGALAALFFHVRSVADFAIAANRHAASDQHSKQERVPFSSSVWRRLLRRRVPPVKPLQNLAQLNLRGFVGKVFSDGTHLSDKYTADGTVAGVSRGKKISNKWKTMKDMLCMPRAWMSFATQCG